MITTRAIVAANQYTDLVFLTGYFNLSLTGDWTATVTVQRSFDNGDTWFDVDTWTENTQEYGLEPERDVCYRVGVGAGDFTAGIVNARLSN